MPATTATPRKSRNAISNRAVGKDRLDGAPAAGPLMDGSDPAIASWATGTFLGEGACGPQREGLAIASTVLGSRPSPPSLRRPEDLQQVFRVGDGALLAAIDLQCVVGEGQAQDEHLRRSRPQGIDRLRGSA